MWVGRTFSARCGKLLLAAVCLLSSLAFAQPVSGACAAQPDLGKVLSQARPSDAKDAGFLWQIEKDGRTSHLYGTMHILPRHLAIPGAKTMQALAASDIAAFEINILDQALVNELQERIKQGPNTMQVNAQQAARFKQLSEKLCTVMLTDKPWPWVYQYVQLTLAEARNIGLEAMFGREVILTLLATNLKKAIVSLETPQVQADALSLGWDIPTSTLNKYLDDLENGNASRILRSMMGYWVNHQLEQLENVDAWCECKDDPAQKRLLIQINDGRNPALASEIDRIHQSGKTVFAAVGALHMTGQAALPKLLAQKGYRVARVF
jgi:uncharacterized protein